MSRTIIYSAHARPSTVEKIINLLELEVNPSYVYSIKDRETGKRYVGKRTSTTRKFKDPRIDFGTSYFSSTTDEAFYNEIISAITHNTNRFMFCILDVFSSPDEASKLESEILTRNSAAKSKKFYNKNNNNGHLDTTGLVPVKDEQGNVVFVSTNEFTSGNYESIGTGMVTVYDTIHGCHVKIPITEFHHERDRYTTVYDGVVSVIEITTGKSVMVSTTEFYENRDKYKRTTDGMVVVVCVESGKNKLIPKEEFDRKVHKSPKCGYTTVKNKLTGLYETVHKDIYACNRDIYENPAAGKVYCIDLSTGNKVTVSKEEYSENKQKYSLRRNVKPK